MKRGIKGLLLVLPLAVAAPAVQAELVYGVNAVASPGAEAGPSNASGGAVASIPSWTASVPGMTVIPYANTSGYPTAADPGPANRGLQFFAGGNNVASSALTQSLSVSNVASDIDTGRVPFTLSGFLGGFARQGDFATFNVRFEDALGAALGSSTLGPVTPVDRSGQTGLLFRSAEGTLPATPRSLIFTLLATRLEGVSNDGYADNLAFVASAPTAIPGSGCGLGPGTGTGAVPEPASISLVAGGLAWLGMRRRIGAA